MRVAVILANPNPDSFAHELARRAAVGLRAGGHEVESVDLYAMGFRAAMSTEEREAYHGRTPILDPMVRAQADLVRSVDALVFVYPTWWSGLPAILKGWLERVMVPGVGFRFDERSGKVRPGLTNVRRLIGISTYGTSARSTTTAVGRSCERFDSRAVCERPRGGSGCTRSTRRQRTNAPSSRRTSSGR